MITHRDLSRWYWAATVGLLAGGLSGWVTGFYLAIALCIVQVLHFAWRGRSLTSFPVQVRVAYLGLLISGQWDMFFFIYWIQLIGTTAMVLFDYCFLARVLSVMPWNRKKQLSLDLLQRTFLSRPVRGSVV